MWAGCGPAGAPVRATTTFVFVPIAVSVAVPDSPDPCWAERLTFIAMPIGIDDELIPAASTVVPARRTTEVRRRR